MGCWGITAFESDEGLDAVEFIRESIPEDGKLELETLVETLKRDSWNAPPEVETAGSHTSVMVLAELMLKFVDGDVKSLDSEEDWNREEHKFCSSLLSPHPRKRSIGFGTIYLTRSIM